ncbi:MAG: peptidoglycan DD-metalloendopeptidase family protein [Oscillospiraceae bacterium]|nr:peptidoglycan DD-metalloendopeptidase family protein [Oscillospiraceae bacterium]
MRWTKRFAMVMAVLLALLILASVLLSGIGRAATLLDTKKNALKSIQEDKKRIEQQIKNVKNDKMAAIKHKMALDEEIRLSEDEIDAITDLIYEYTVQIAETQRAYEDAIADETDKEERFRTRIRAMEEMGAPSYVGVLMESTSFSDLLGRVSIVNEIAENDRKIMEELRVAREKIAEARYQLESEKDEQQAAKKLLAESHAFLLRKYKEMDDMIASIEAEQKAYEQMYKDAQAEEEKFNNEIKKIMEEQARKNAVYIGGGMNWPVPGHTTITSGYGMRKHPVYKTNRMHTGIDISAPKGAKIVAANDGTVILSTYNGGYGNCVVIDHGGGISTLYGHASKLLVKKGQKVKRGETIALIGSTGVSTGNHLHFEISEKGVHKNPQTWKQPN